MTNEFRKKAVELGKLMNSKSKLSVPLVKCIIECFEIVFDEQDIDYMLLMKDGYYSRDELKELWQLDGEAFEKVFTSIRDKGGIWESRQEGVYDIIADICRAGLSCMPLDRLMIREDGFLLSLQNLRNFL